MDTVKIKEVKGDGPLLINQTFSINGYLYQVKKIRGRNRLEIKMIGVQKK